MVAPRLLAAVGSCLALGALGCGGGNAAPDSDKALQEVVAAANRTTRAGPSHIIASTHHPGGSYSADGRVDFAHGYRMCAQIERTPGGQLDFLEGHMLWLAGSGGTYDTVTRPIPVEKGVVLPPPRCRRNGWFDDHPPTLALREARGLKTPARGEGGLRLLGAENYLHMALLALADLERGAVRAAPLGDRGYRVAVDFARLDTKPDERDEDAWQMRPLLRRTGELPVTVTINSEGYVSELGLKAESPIRSGEDSGRLAVHLRLSAIGNEQAVPVARVFAIE